jgi:hypothetical protein
LELTFVIIMDERHDQRDLMPPREEVFDHLYLLLIARYASAESHHLPQFGKIITHQSFAVADEATPFDSVHRNLSLSVAEGVLDGLKAPCGDALSRDALPYMSALCVSARQQMTPSANSARCFTVGRAIREALAAAARSSRLSLSMRINMALPLRAAQAGPISQLHIDITQLLYDITKIIRQIDTRSSARRLCHVTKYSA